MNKAALAAGSCNTFDHRTARPPPGFPPQKEDV